MVGVAEFVGVVRIDLRQDWWGVSRVGRRGYELSGGVARRLPLVWWPRFWMATMLTLGGAFAGSRSWQFPRGPAASVLILADVDAGFPALSQQALVAGDPCGFQNLQERSQGVSINILGPSSHHGRLSGGHLR